MPFTKLSYSKDWRNAADFPAIEADERKVREDMQFLYEEIKEYINNVLLGMLDSTEAARNILMKDGASVQQAVEQLGYSLTDNETADEAARKATRAELDFLRGEVSVLEGRVRHLEGELQRLTSTGGTA